MQNESYDDYIRSILGYPKENAYVSDIQINQTRSNSNTELEMYYPEIYKIVYPMVVKSVRNNTKQITKERIEELTEEVFSSIEEKDEKRGPNPVLRDLIRILLLRELINSFPRPPRPPFPGGNPRPPMRPPFNQPGFNNQRPFFRDFELNNPDIYEI